MTWYHRLRFHPSDGCSNLACSRAAGSAPTLLARATHSMGVVAGGAPLGWIDVGAGETVSVPGDHDSIVQSGTTADAVDAWVSCFD